MDEIVWNGLTSVVPEDESGEFDDLKYHEDFSSNITFEYNEDFTPELWEMFHGGPAPKSPAFAMQIKSYACPVAVPRKRRGLTGKAYRSARRKYHREMRQWRRGHIPSTEILQVFYDVRPIELTPVPGRPDEVSIQFVVQ